MSEVDRILDQLQRAFDGDPWYGPSLSDALDGVDARLAVERPIADDWPAVDVINDAEWESLLDALDAAHEGLVGQMTALKDADLDGVIGDVRDRAQGTGVSRYVMLHGLVQHHVYHAGQISLLRKIRPAPDRK
jgi:hypothetical protein